MKNTIKFNPVRLISACVFAVTLFFYLLTVGPYVYWQDAGIYLAAVKDFGIPPTTGFPLHMLTCKLLTLIFSDFLRIVDFVVAVCAVSAICSAIASSLIAVIIYNLMKCSFKFFEKTNGALQVEPEKNQNKFAHVLCAIFGGLLFGLGFYPWSQAVNAEVYSMAAMFLGLTFYFVFKLGEIGRIGNTLSRRQKTYLMLLAISAGFSFNTHLMMSAPLLGVFVFLIAINYKIFKHAGFLFLISLTLVASYIGPHMYFLLIPQYASDFQFADISTADGFFKYIFAYQWGGDPTGWFDLPLDRFLTFPRLLYEEYHIFGLIAVCAGLYLLYKRNARLTMFIISIYLLQLFTAWAYLRGSEYDMWMITGYLMLSIPAAAALYEVYKIARANLKIASVSTASMLVLVPLAYTSYPHADKSNYPYAEELGKNILKNLDQNSIVVLTADADIATAFYLQIVRNYRKDVIILMRNYLWAEWYLNHLKEFYKLQIPLKSLSDYDIEFARFATGLDFTSYQVSGPDIRDLVLNDIIYLNIPKRPVFFRDALKVPLKHNLKIMPAGTLYKIVDLNVDDVDLKYWEYTFSNPDFAGLEKSERHLGQLYRRVPQGTGKIKLFIARRTYISELISFKADAHRNLARWHLFKGNRHFEDKSSSYVVKEHYSKAVSQYEEYIKLKPDHQEAEVYYDMATLYFSLARYAEAEKLIKEFRDWYPKMFREYQILYLQKLIHLINLQARIYELRGDQELAQFYYNQAANMPVSIKQE